MQKPQVYYKYTYIFVRYENTLQFYFWYTKLVYLKSAKLEQLILYLMHFNLPEVCWSST